jgi:copper homeostasis protein
VRGPRILEITVEAVDAAVSAQRGGAHRIELCSQLEVGGLTPSGGLMQAVRRQISLPMFAMIRPRAGDFVYFDAEFATMQLGIETAKRLGMNGVVLGILKEDARVDVERTRQLVELARPLPVTFHRAFDATADLHEALEDVIQTGATRILTSGGAPTAAEGLAALTELVAAAGNRILIVPGGGLKPANILRVAQGSRAREFHSGLSSALGDDERHGELFKAEVRKLATQLALCE